jgi:hypothetical protein
MRSEIHVGYSIELVFRLVIGVAFALLPLCNKGLHSIRVIDWLVHLVF